MGYHIHHTIVVTCWQSEMLKDAHERAVVLFGPLCSEIIESALNGYGSFFIAPDGSKEGWPESMQHDDLRNRYKAWLKSANTFVDWVEVSFGGDEPDQNTMILENGYYKEPTNEENET